MNTAFIQDYADVEVTARQRAAIAGYARNRGIEIDAWVNASDFSIDSLRAGDELLVEKTFRLAKDVRSIAALLEALLSKGVIICSCEDGVRFGGEGESSAQMAYLFGMVAKIAEELRSQLTKEGLETAQAAGRTLGRPRGRKNSNHKLDVKKNEIRKLLRSGKTEPEICRMLNIPRSSLFVYVKDRPELKQEAVNA